MVLVKQILTLVIFAFLISSCSMSSNVVSGNFIQQRKYNKGFHFSRKMKVNLGIGQKKVKTAPVAKEVQKTKSYLSFDVKEIETRSLNNSIRSKKIKNKHINISANNEIDLNSQNVFSSVSKLNMSSLILNNDSQNRAITKNKNIQEKNASEKPNHQVFVIFLASVITLILTLIFIYSIFGNSIGIILYFSLNINLFKIAVFTALFFFFYFSFDFHFLDIQFETINKILNVFFLIIISILSVL